MDDPFVSPPREFSGLSSLFGSYRAEWLDERIYDLFTEPAYLPELKTTRPCMLMGGRGTGKTTVLRCLSYEGQFALSGRRNETIPDWPFYGLYCRINTNRVAAFYGAELTKREWDRLFGHYINLLFCELLGGFAKWYNKISPECEQLSATACSAISTSLSIPKSKDIDELYLGIQEGLLSFEAFINTLEQSSRPGLSMQGAPVDVFAKELRKLSQFRGKLFFFLLDEYENLSADQQRIVNTLVKHAGEHYTFKIGVKELGLHSRTTTNENEILVSPADFVRIDITESLAERFPQFAANVCNERLKHLDLDAKKYSGVEELFPEISEEEEATLLGVEAKIKSEIEALVPPRDIQHLEEFTPLQQYVLILRSKSQGVPLDSVISEAKESASSWNYHYGNYKHAALFAIKRGKSGIRKYYAGWNVFTQLAGGNIRFLMQLVEQSILLHLQKSESLLEPIPVPTQTEASQAVGRKNLREMEAVLVGGAKLTKLLLSLGRIFGRMAETPEGHTPEVNQFALDGSRASDPEARERVTQRAEDIIRTAVMHLALVRFVGSKLQDSGYIRDYDYSIHPIFSPFFVYSYRRKRKMALFPEDILQLVESPKDAISDILGRQNRTLDDPLPDQLRLFEAFYENNRR